MVAEITSDLQRVLAARNPEFVDVLIDAEPMQGDFAQQSLRERGITFTRVGVRGRTVFEATVRADDLDGLAEARGIGRIDHSPTFAPTGMAPSLPPGQAAAELAPEVRRSTLKEVTGHLGVEEAWEESGTRGEGAVIGVVDTPVDTSHPALSHASIARGGPGGAEDHGCWVASAAVGRETQTRQGSIRGVAPDADLVTYGALRGGAAGIPEIAEGIEFCIEHGADIINLSLGGPHSDLFHDIISDARADGVVVVTSAGNSGPGGGTISCPAHHAEAVTVGSVGSDEAVAAFSSRGPGYNDAPRKPDVMAYGGDSRVEDGGHYLEEVVLGAAAGGGGRYLLGTSMSAPQIAGLAALRVSKLRQMGVE